MKQIKAFELLENGTLKVGSKVKISGLAGYDQFKTVEAAYIHPPRAGELEEAWVVVEIDGKAIDASWIDEVQN